MTSSWAAYRAEEAGIEKHCANNDITFDLRLDTTVSPTRTSILIRVVVALIFPPRPPSNPTGRTHW